MKITKAKLKQIIKEELEDMDEGMVDGEGTPPPGPWYEKGKVYPLEENEADQSEEAIDRSPESMAVMPIGDWGARVLELLPNMRDAWNMGVTPEEFVDNLQEKLSMEAPTDPLAMSYARGEI